MDKETAKVVIRAIETVEKVGGFIALHTGGSLEQGMAIFEEKLKNYAALNQLNFITSYSNLANKLGIKLTMKPVSLKYTLPLLEAVSLEEDDYLQSLWVNLLMNASNEQSNINLQRSHISILEQLTSLEAKTLEVIYGVDELEFEKNSVVTCDLPDEVNVVSERDINNSDIQLENPPDDVKLALANLARLRLVALPMTFGGGEIYSYVNHTLLGQRFVAACTIDI